MNQTNITSPADLAEALRNIGETAKNNNNQLSFAELRTMLEGMTLSGDQINQIWRFLDSARILVFHIDEDDILFQGIALDKTVYIGSAPDPASGKKSDAPEKKRGFFFRRK